MDKNHYLIFPRPITKNTMILGHLGSNLGVLSPSRAHNKGFTILWFVLSHEQSRFCKKNERKHFFRNILTVCWHSVQNSAVVCMSEKKPGDRLNVYFCINHYSVDTVWITGESMYFVLESIYKVLLLYNGIGIIF